MNFVSTHSTISNKSKFLLQGFVCMCERETDKNIVGLFVSVKYFIVKQDIRITYL